LLLTMMPNFDKNSHKEEISGKNKPHVSTSKVVVDNSSDEDADSLADALEEQVHYCEGRRFKAFRRYLLAQLNR
jgi:hypothetical protein